MKKFISGLFFIAFMQTIGLNGIAQNVNIPDIVFKNKLIALGIDLNFDSEISYTEAELVTDLDVSFTMGSFSINDLTGIEAFVNLTKLNCSGNSLSILNFHYNTSLKDLNCSGCTLTNLDISNNDSLEILNCMSNDLTNLDVSNNTNLKTLYCGINGLTSLNVSNNTMLQELRIGGNQVVTLDVSNNVNLIIFECSSASLTSLDVTHNIYLEELNCSTNQLTSLDISNNINLTKLYIFGMPSLTQVCVWILPFPDSSNVQVTSFGSPNIVYEICNIGFENIVNENSLSVYPNPSKNVVSVLISKESEIEILNLEGQELKRLTATEKLVTVDISALARGFYFIKMTTEKGIITKKFLKQ